ncbi:transposase [Kibdelosporangium aridum]|uniref:Transposase IS116/IS110/IS902 family protein n=1 Tax=Kibdelosporangium aridum TaxID=2030 RepID=A0A1W2FWY2_KIBAR|nr:Transposase IS116/IS110/IS902 family protein [Kibdelosporangium aridum]
MAVQALALLATLNATCAGIEQLGQATIEAFRQHADHQVITSFPGLGEISGARLLAEIGDDRDRFTDARALNAYAGSAPVTRASGRSTSITRRLIKNNRLAAVGFTWAFMAMTNSPSARAHYTRRRTTGDGHPSALRHLFNQMLGQLHHCLHTGETYDETKAFPIQTTNAADNYDLSEVCTPPASTPHPAATAQPGENSLPLKPTPSSPVHSYTSTPSDCSVSTHWYSSTTAPAASTSPE